MKGGPMTDASMAEKSWKMAPKETPERFLK